MVALEENDRSYDDDVGFSSERIREALERLNNKRSELEGYLARLEENDGEEISAIDPDCRIMKRGENARNLDARYNVQVVADGKNKLIVDFEVTNCPDDKGAPPQMTESAKEIMGVSEITAVADRGYYDGGDVADREAAGTICLAPKTISGRRAPSPEYDYERFKYNGDTDCYVCPMENALYHKRTKKRKEIIEHPFGTIKRGWGFGNFLCRGLRITTSERSMAFGAYNFRRVYNIFRETARI